MEAETPETDMMIKEEENLVNNTADKRHILYTMDEFSRLTVGVVIENRKPSTVVKEILELWCL